jgi:hypothetical protein
LFFGRKVVRLDLARGVGDHGHMLTGPGARVKGEAGPITRSKSTRRLERAMVPFST